MPNHAAKEPGRSRCQIDLNWVAGVSSDTLRLGVAGRRQSQRRQRIDARQAFEVWRTADREFRHSYRGSVICGASPGCCERLRQPQAFRKFILRNAQIL